MTNLAAAAANYILEPLREQQELKPIDSKALTGGLLAAFCLVTGPVAATALGKYLTAFAVEPHFPPQLAYLVGRFVGYVGIWIAVPLAMLPVLRFRCSDIDLKLGKLHEIAPVLMGLFLIMVAPIILASSTPSFQAMYPYWKGAEQNTSTLLIWWAIWSLSFLATEFFFRGFLLTLSKPYIGGYCVLFSTLPYALTHLGKPYLEMLGSIPAGIVLASLALRARTIWGGFLLHIGVAITMDLSAIANR